MRHSPSRLLAFMLAGAAFVAACSSSHGTYTQAFKDEANERMALVKAGAQWDMAQQQFLSGDLEKALKTVDGSIAIAPKVAKSHKLRGRIMLELGRMDESLNSFEQAIKLDPEMTEAYYFKGVVLERLSETENALACYQKAQSLDRSNPQYVVASAEMLIEMGRLDEAKALLEPASGSKEAHFPHSPGVRQTLGHIAMIQNDYPKACIYFQEACTLLPDDLGLVEDLARAQFSAKRFADCESSIHRVLAKDEHDQRRDLRMMLARCMAQNSKLADARTLLLQLTSGAAGEADLDAWRELGNVAVVLNDMPRVREAGNRVIALAPQRYEGYMLLGLYHRKTGKLDQAADFLEKSTQRTTDDPAPAILCGLVNEQLGQAEVARADYQRALTISPNNERATRLLQRLNGQNTAVAGAPATTD